MPTDEPLKFQDTREREEWLRACLACATSPAPVRTADGSQVFADDFADDIIEHLRARDGGALRATRSALLELADEYKLSTEDVLEVILDNAFDDDRVYSAIIEDLKERGVGIARQEVPS